MNQFSVACFFALGTAFHSLDYCLTRFSGHELTGPVTENNAGHIGRLLKMAQSECDFAGLTASSATIGRCLKKIDAQKISMAAVIDRIQEIQESIEEEMEETVFLAIPASRKKAYLTPQNFLGGICESFPSIEFEIEECGKCFACGRWTAAVFHAMRTLEAGLTALGNKMVMKRGANGWNDDLRQFRSRWTGIATGSISLKSIPNPAKWDQFMHDAFTDFFHFKNAWRNHVMHKPSTTYTEETSTRIIGSVKSFMAHLATRLSERRR